jgi:peptidoglycan hydrolase-like protein with peptidoglycan-binding domain
MPTSINDRPTTRPASLPSSTQLENAIQREGLVEKGNDGAAVREAQALLKAHGVHVDVDGQFGPKTHDAVVAFQRSRGIAADGLIGPDTLRELRTPTTGVDNRTGRDTGITARPQDRVPGMTGADFQRRAEADAARRTRETPAPNGTTTDGARGGNTPVTLAPAGASQQEKFNHYRNIVLQNGGQDPLTSNKPVVLGVRGIDRNGNAHETKNARAFDDTFVVLNKNGSVTELRGSTHAGQATSSLVSAVGMIRSGNFDVMPNGVRAGKDQGLPSWVVTKNGSGSLPGIRDRNHDGRFQAGEIANRDALTEVLFHPGSADSPHSIGCQTLPPDEYRRFLRAIGTQGFNYSLVDANGRT